jgi:hypothetical protein
MSTTVDSIKLPLTFRQVLDLVKQLPFEKKKKIVEAIQKENIEASYNISEKDKALVLNRIKTDKTEDLLDWKTVKRKMSTK